MDATRQVIRRMLTEALTYLDIGHDWDKPFDTWVLMPDSDDIQYASKLGKEPEFFHDEFGGRADLKGRVDPGKRAISMVTERSRDSDRIQYAAKVLTAEHPGYAVWLFRSALAPPQKLTEADETVPYSGFPQPGDKGMLLVDKGGWVSWSVEWPRGTPHHDDIMEAYFPYDEAAATASIPPRPGKNYEINLHVSLTASSDGEPPEVFGNVVRGMILQLGRRMSSVTKVVIETGAGSFKGTLAAYKRRVR